MAKETKPPRIPQSRDFLWKSLRIMRRATARQLAAVTMRPKNSVQVDLRALVATGYVRLDGKGGRGGRDVVHTLVRDSGPKPPLFVLNGKTLLGAVDRNTLETFGIDGGAPPHDLLKRRANWMPKLLLRKEAS